MNIGVGPYKGEQNVLKWVKWLAGVVSSLAVLAGAAAWAGDTRWIKIEESKQDDQRVTQQVLAQVQMSFERMRRQALEDKIYEITLIPASRRTDVQRALLDRTIRQLDQLNRHASITD